MGSKSSSSSSKSTSTTTKNETFALDQSATIQDGMGVLDSIIVDPSDDVMVEAMAGMKSAFSVMTSNSTVQLGELLSMGEELLGFVNQGQATLANSAYDTLVEGVSLLQGAQDQGAYLIDFAADATSDTFDLAQSVTSDSAGLAQDALSIVADVKTGEHTDVIKTVALAFLILSLGAIYMGTTRGKK